MILPKDFAGGKIRDMLLSLDGVEAVEEGINVPDSALLDSLSLYDLKLALLLWEQKGTRLRVPMWFPIKNLLGVLYDSKVFNLDVRTQLSFDSIRDIPTEPTLLVGTLDDIDISWLGPSVGPFEILPGIVVWLVTRPECFDNIRRIPAALEAAEKCKTQIWQRPISKEVVESVMKRVKQTADSDKRYYLQEKNKSLREFTEHSKKAQRCLNRYVVMSRKESEAKDRVKSPEFVRQELNRLRDIPIMEGVMMTTTSVMARTKPVSMYYPYCGSGSHKYTEEFSVAGENVPGSKVKYLCQNGHEIQPGQLCITCWTGYRTIEIHTVDGEKATPETHSVFRWCKRCSEWSPYKKVSFPSYTVTVNLNESSDSAITIRDNRNTNEHPHPHISSGGGPCWGSARGIPGMLVKSGDYHRLLTMVGILIHSYVENDAYVGLGGWVDGNS